MTASKIQYSNGKIIENTHNNNRIFIDKATYYLISLELDEVKTTETLLDFKNNFPNKPLRIVTNLQNINTLTKIISGFANHLFYHALLNDRNNFYEDLISEDYSSGNLLKLHNKIPINVEKNVRDILYNKMCFPIDKSFNSPYREKSQEYHINSILNLTTQPITVATDKNNNINGLFSFIGANIVENLYANVISIYINENCDRPLRKYIINKFFNSIKDQNIPSVAFIHYKNKKSLSLFDKNNFKILFSVLYFL